jgi:SRSO17 transposase
MDATIIQQIKPNLNRFLKQFDGCFGRRTVRRYLGMYVEGQLGPLQRKSIEPMADAAGEPPRNLQQFFSLFRWDHALMRDLVQRLVAQKHAVAHSIGIFDETTFVKKGDKTAGVQHQYCGAVGKQENCMMSVHLAYATPDGFHCMLDGELYLPKETWHEDRERCREAGIPDDYVYRPKWRMALDQLTRANANGVRMTWLTFDEAYSRVGEFRRALEERGQNYVAEVPTNFAVWTKRPEALCPAHARDGEAARPIKGRRLKIKNNPRVEVRNILKYSSIMRNEPWVNYHVKEGTKGPIVWKAKRIMVWPADAQDMPGTAYHLIVARNVLKPKEVKYFVSNAPPQTAIETLLLVAFSRWHVERAFEDCKEELGLKHFEVRQFQCIQRHLILSCVSYLFLAQMKYDVKKKRTDEPDDSPIAGSDRATGAAVDAGWSLYSQAGRIDQP